jgi:hypothetical protein
MPPQARMHALVKGPRPDALHFGMPAACAVEAPAGRTGAADTDVAAEIT